MLVSDGARLLIGHAPRSPLWDIPKGLAEAGEDFAAAARRELREETGLEAPAEALLALGVHGYLPRKDLALFAWRLDILPDPATLSCRSFLRTRDGAWLPEFDAFAVLPWEAALQRVGRNLARVVSELRRSPSWPLERAEQA